MAKEEKAGKEDWRGDRPVAPTLGIFKGRQFQMPFPNLSILSCFHAQAAILIFQAAAAGAIIIAADLGRLGIVGCGFHPSSI